MTSRGIFCLQLFGDFLFGKICAEIISRHFCRKLLIPINISLVGFERDMDLFVDRCRDFFRHVFQGRNEDSSCHVFMCNFLVYPVPTAHCNSGKSYWGGFLFTMEPQ